MEHNIPDYQSLASALDKLDTEITPSEVHGTLCGLLCADVAAKTDKWQKSLWPDTPMDKNDLLQAETLELFEQLHDVTRLQLNDPNCEFQLLLPDDEEPIGSRVQALGDWCQAFLMGLAMGGIKDLSSLPENGREIANDLVEIARAGTSYDLEGDEEDENAYTELVEYLRVGVLLINEELQPVKTNQQADTNLH